MNTNNIMRFISLLRLLSSQQLYPSESYIQDKQTGTMSARGLFGTRKSGGFLGNLFRTDYKNVGNTNVVHCGDSLYALWEGGKPYLLDPLTLKNKVCFVATHYCMCLFYVIFTMRYYQ